MCPHEAAALTKNQMVSTVGSMQMERTESRRTGEQEQKQTPLKGGGSCTASSINP